MKKVWCLRIVTAVTPPGCPPSGAVSVLRHDKKYRSLCPITTRATQAIRLIMSSVFFSSSTMGSDMRSNFTRSTSFSPAPAPLPAPPSTNSTASPSCSFAASTTPSSRELSLATSTLTMTVFLRLDASSALPPLLDASLCTAITMSGSATAWWEIQWR